MYSNQLFSDNFNDLVLVPKDMAFLIMIVLLVMTLVIIMRIL